MTFILKKAGKCHSRDVGHGHVYVCDGGFHEEVLLLPRKYHNRDPLILWALYFRRNRNFRVQRGTNELLQKQFDSTRVVFN